MPAIYLHEHIVTNQDVDDQGHANNLSYLKWMQDAAVAHSTAQGWATSDYHEKNWAWVVRSHHIEYRRPAFEDDVVTVRTWVADMKKYTSLRKYELLREDGKLFANAETNWAFVELPAGKLIPVPNDVQSSFEIGPETK